MTGLFLYSKNFGEKSKFYTSYQRLWFDKGTFKVIQKKNINLINLDKIKFTWSSRNQNSLGYLNYEQKL